MERAIWIFACMIALSLATGLSSLSSTQSNTPKNPQNLELNSCKNKCMEQPSGSNERVSEMFMRKVKRKTRKAYA